MTSVISRDDYAALWHLDRVLAGGSDVPAYWLERADIHARLGHTQLALADLERVLALDPRRPTEWGVVLRVLQALPENDPVKNFESRALSRWLSTTGSVADARQPASSSNLLPDARARRRWDLAGALLRNDSSPDEGRFVDYSATSANYAITLLRKGDLAAYRAFRGPAIRSRCGGRLKVYHARLLVGVPAGTGRRGRPRRVWFGSARSF